jgi:DNA-binding response OmpR family regulator
MREMRTLTDKASDPSLRGLPPAQCAAMHVLVVEDEPKMAALIRRVLVAERHVVDIAPDGISAVALADQGPHDVIVLDRMLPDIDGFTVLRLLRAKGIATPVLMLTALGTVDDRVAGLDAGADDYLAKPFAFSELLARIRALGRRPAAASDARLAAGDLVLDELRHVAQVGERTVDLSAREFALLGFFIRHAGQVVTRQQILDQVWGAEPDVYSNVVDLYVSYLRRSSPSSIGRTGSGRSGASATRCAPRPRGWPEAPRTACSAGRGSGCSSRPWHCSRCWWWVWVPRPP